MSIYDTLNASQQEAVLHTEGPLLILAGAGSGKTRVLTHRITYLIEEKEVNPWNIMAITFTNKAAEEMRDRVDRLVQFGAESIWVATFHSTCVRILRRYADRIGYDTNFTIYDSDDQKTLMKEICKRLNIDTKNISEKAILSQISAAKDEMIMPDEFEINAGVDYVLRKIAGAYKEYQKQLKKNNAMDFDDLLCSTVNLFLNNPDVLEYHQDRFRYIMVDEYQDTNTVQFRLIELLARKYKNLCVVGDDDQSIYKFRGANIRNILDFEKTFPNTKVVRLEQNYRSNANILNAANSVIKNNKGRKDKTLWTEQEDGDKVAVFACENAYEEAERIVKDIKHLSSNEMRPYSDFAVLYRTNAQSRVLEEQFVRANLPYKVVGGVNFYQRKEIKDLIAYLKTVDGARDDVAVKRIINVPKRGIGLTTVDRVQDYALQQDMSFYEALRVAEDIPGIGRGVAKLTPFVNLISRLRASLPVCSLTEILEEIIEATGYVTELVAEGTEEAKARIENIEEFVSKMKDYEEKAEEPTLAGFLEEVALIADIDSLEDSDNRVVLMTLHSAKGLEFPFVYLAGMEDGLFPSYMAITSDDKTDLEEERRLCYVGITRAMEHLTVSYAKQRTLRGETRYNMVSRFLKEIPVQLLDTAVGGVAKATAAQGGSGYGGSKGFGGYGSAGTGAGFTGRTAGNSYGRIPGGKPDLSAYKGSTITKAANLEYEIGDTVSHIKFGVGMVMDIADGGRDYEVTVNFEKFGIKKMFASFAKLKKL
ncbi:MAG: DNA helicase PcrA [Lachnospiraceae bacterium]|nr:DNA helicase PcrA [Lachnospiraceae bacterium]